MLHTDDHAGFLLIMGEGYETSKRYFAKRYDPIPVWALLSSGGIGGICYWLACYPLDVVKSRVQLAAEPPSKGGWLSGGYISRELRVIVHEGGTSVPSFFGSLLQ